MRPPRVFAGPAFIPSPNSDDPVTVALIGPNQVAAPTHFFRIHLWTSDGTLKVNAYLVPNQLQVDQDINTYLVTVKTIGEVTGLRFIARLPQEEREAITSREPNTDQ